MRVVPCTRAATTGIVFVIDPCMNFLVCPRIYSGVCVPLCPTLKTYEQLTYGLIENRWRRCCLLILRRRVKTQNWYDRPILTNGHLAGDHFYRSLPQSTLTTQTLYRNELLDSSEPTGTLCGYLTYCAFVNSPP